jgi:hypothetical protein
VKRVPRVSDVYESRNYMNASDISKPITSKIKGVSVESMKDGKKKIVLTLEGQEKSLVLNKTNAGTLTARFGEEYDRWGGQEVTLASVPTTFQGQNVRGLRIL